MTKEKIVKLIIGDVRRFSFYTMVFASLFTLVSFQNCGKVRFNAPRTQAIVPQSCGTITMVPQNGLSTDTNVTFTVIPPTGITISNISWDVTKDANSVYTSNVNPMSHTFNNPGEGIGSYLATAVFMKSDGNACELAQSFQILTGDLCVDPSGISGPAIGFVGEETSPFSIDFEDCFVGTVIWDMDTNGIPEYNNNVSDSVTYTYTTPGTYTVTATVIDGEDNSQTVLTHTIVINYENCTNGATNPPVCDQCPTGQVFVGGQCVNQCTNSATNPPTCDQCPMGLVLVGGQCVPPNACTLDGVVVPHGQSRNFFRVNVQACGQTCSETPRTCNNGVLSGDPAFNRATCLEASCGYAWELGNWSACSTTVCGTSGTQTRTAICRRTDGVVVANSFCGAPPQTTQPCNAAACLACNLPWGGTIAHGQSAPAFQASQVACGQTCATENRACNNGVLSGTFVNQSCSAAACPVNGACGSANGTSVSNPPTANLCAAGTASAVTTNSANYAWDCTGSNGGSTASCSATRQRFAVAACGFSLTSSNWSPRPPTITNGYASCDWIGQIYMGSSNQVSAIFYIADYVTPQGIPMLNNPSAWTITATGCTLGQLYNSPLFCQSTRRSHNGTPTVFNATITARNNSTGEIISIPITATFRPTLSNTPL